MWKETHENKMVTIGGCCDDSQSCEQLKKHVTDKHFEKKLDFEYESPSVKGKICGISTWCICLREIPKEKHLRLSDYLNQIKGPLLSALSALQCFGFPSTTAAKATHLQELGTSG